MPAVRPVDCRVTSYQHVLVLGCRYSSCSEQLIAKLLLLVYLVLPSLAADIQAVPSSWLLGYFFFSTWSSRPWLQIFQLFRTADWKATSPLPGLALLNCRYSSCSEQLIAKLLLLYFFSTFFSTWSCHPWLQIFQLFRTADCKVTSSSLPGLAILGCKYSSCSDHLIGVTLLSAQAAKLGKNKSE